MKIQFTRENKVPVSRGNIGLFLEDINYALDGGLYAEMLENANFEAKKAWGTWNDYSFASDGAYAWEPYGDAVLKVKTDRPLFRENPHYMRLVANAPDAGMTNKAYDGIYLQKKMKYRISFYARSFTYKGAVQVSVFSDGDPAFAKKVKLRPDGKWHRYEFMVKSNADMERATFKFSLQKAGIVHVDCLSMMPENAILGVFRRDLVLWMKDLKPGFLRFPGGCIVEGNTLESRYLWKNSVGRREERKHNWNRWAVHDTEKYEDHVSPYAHYGQSLGIGYYEYFCLCEYLGAKPLPVVNVGMACQYQSTDMVDPESPEFEAFLQDALDVVEFARGGTDTVWGAVRAEMGHPQPFALEYLGVGNEQWQEVNKAGKNNAFHRRYEIFEKRLHEKYPDLKLIGTTGPDVDSKTHEAAWEWIRDKLEDNPDFVYAADEHFYVPEEWMYANAHRYDGYPRDARVYAGEYATHVKSANAGNFNAPEANLWAGALAEAAFMTGMEQNSDIVVMASYAPLFARLHYAQWSPDLIWFDGKSSYATANYYVQQLYSLYAGDYALKTTVDGENVYASCAEREGMVFVKVVNAGDEAVEAEIEGDFEFGSLTRILCMDGERGDYNTVETPNKIIPHEVAPAAERSLTLPPRSFSVLVFMK